MTVNRTLVGVIALGCFAAAGLLFLFGAETGPARLWAAAFVRVGLLMSAFWWALPAGKGPTPLPTVSGSTLLGIVLAVFAVARYPRTIFPLLLVLGVIGWLLRPRNRRAAPPIRQARSNKPAPNNNAAVQPTAATTTTAQTRQDAAQQHSTQQHSRQ